MAESAWREVGSLRKSGKLQEAENLGLRALAERPEDAYLKAALAWVYYERIKIICTGVTQRAKLGQAPSDVILAAEVQSITRELGRYVNLDPKVPDLVHSQILRLLTKVGRKMPRFVPFLRFEHWRDLEQLRDEDYLENSATNSAIKYPSLAAGIVREALHWCKNHRESESLEWSLAWAIKVQRRTQDKHVALDIARALASTSRLDEAIEWSRTTVELNQRASWAWSALGGTLAMGGNRDEAIAALCASINFDKSGDYTGKPRALLARLLVARGDLAWAAREAASVKIHYERKGWGNIPGDALAVVNADWYSDSLRVPCDDMQLRLSAAEEAGLLLIRDVRSECGCYLGLDFQKRPIIAITQSGTSRIVRDVARSKMPGELVPGTGLQLQLGAKGTHEAVIAARVDESLAPWAAVASTPPDPDQLGLGTVCRFTGTLRKLPKGGGFLDLKGGGSIFVDGSVADRSAELEELTVVAEWSRNRKKNVDQWKAIARVEQL